MVGRGTLALRRVIRPIRGTVSPLAVSVVVSLLLFDAYLEDEFQDEADEDDRQNKRKPLHQRFFLPYLVIRLD